MPIYEFKCNDCNSHFEVLLLGDESGVCPSCQGKSLTRLISRCGFVSKISGGDGADNASRSSSFSSACSGCTASNCSSCTSGS
ncbi:MAG: zinc ribbon domain-containing protein [Desulfobacteraceae bacterium]